jgi:hypothetical protein
MSEWDPNEGEILYAEEDDWIPPRARSQDELDSNTHWLGPFYLWHGAAPQGHHWWIPLSPALTYEIHEPWRRGYGICFCLAKWGLAIGVGWKTSPPSILSEAPREENLEEVVAFSRRVK